MISISRLGLGCVIALACACGKNGGDKGQADPTNPKVNGGGSGSAAAGSGDTGAAVKPPAAPKRGPEHSVFSLWDNRLAVHHQRGGGLFIPGGSAGLVKYLRFGRSKLSWKIKQEVDGVAAAVMNGKVVGLHVPLSADQAAGSPKLRVRLHSAQEQRLGFRINGKKKQEITAQVVAGWQTVELDAPEGTLEHGENELLFFANRGAFALAWLQVGGVAGPGEAPAVADKDAFVMPDGGGLDAYVMIPADGLVTGEVIGAGCEVTVTATPHDGEAISGTLRGKGSAVKLGGLAGRVVRLGLRAAKCPSARLASASLTVPGAAPTFTRGEKPKHIVMWVMDSLRADKIPIFVKGARAEVPVLEGLKDKAAVFLQAYVQGNETKASHASIWTSLYPVRHRMIPPNSKIDPKWYTVDELAKDNGLTTSGVSGNGYIVSRRGFGSKWDKYRNHIHDGGGLRAAQILGKGIDSLKGIEKEPWFLYLGTIDTHVSWRAKEPWFSKYDPGPYSGRFKKEASGQDMGAYAGGKLKINKRDEERIRALYDSNVSYQDQQVGELLKWLESQGIADDTMLIITADHGDELFEVGRVGHGSSIRDSLVHVPLLIHYPRMFPGGAIPEGAETVDIVPTIADALGVEANAEWQGQSLLPLASGIGRGYPRLSMATLYENAHVGRLGAWKLRASGSRAKLYNMIDDPDEMKDVAEQRPIERRFVSDALWQLRAFNVEWRKSIWGNAANVTAAYARSFKE